MRFFSAIVLLLPLFAFSQTTFEKIYDTEHLSSVSGAVQDQWGNFLFYYEGEINSSPFGGGDPEVFLTKTDSLGTHLWTKQYGFGVDEGIYHYSVATNGDRYAFCGFLLGEGTASRDGFLVITDTTGTILNVTKMDHGEDSNAFHAVKAVASGWILAGRSSAGGGEQYDMSLTKVDLDGNIEWSQCYGADGWDWSFWADEYPGGGYLLAGYGDGFGGEWDDPYLIRTDAAGNKIWSRTIETSASEDYLCVKVGPSGSIYASGYTLGMVKGNPYNKGFIIKMDINGNIMWTRVLEEVTEIPHFAITVNERLFVIGSTYDDESVYGESDIALAIIDDTGALQNTFVFGSTEDEYARSIVQTSDGGFFIAGGTFGFEGEGQKLLGIHTDASGLTDCTAQSVDWSLVEVDITSSMTVDFEGEGFAQETFIYTDSISSAYGFSVCCADSLELTWSGITDSVAGEIQLEYNTNIPADVAVYINDEFVGYLENGSGNIPIENTADFEACLVAVSQCDSISDCQLFEVNSSIARSHYTWFTLSPNPASESLKLSFPKTSVLPANVTISSLAGKTIRSVPITSASQTIDLSSMAKGSYIISAIDQHMRFSALLILE